MSQKQFCPLKMANSANQSHISEIRRLRTKSKMINICSGNLERLVTLRTKFQMTYIYRDEMSI